MTDLEFRIARLADGEISARDALTLAREALNSAGSEEDIYGGMSAAIWRNIASRQFGEVARGWFDTCKQISALLKTKGHQNLAERLCALADLSMASARFGEAHAKDSVLKRPYVMAILQVVKERGGLGVWREDVLAATAVGEANLSKILGAMEGIGLVIRRRVDQRVAIDITPEGMQALQKPISPPPSKPTAPSAPRDIGGVRTPKSQALDITPDRWRDVH